MSATIEISGPQSADAERVLTADALAFLGELVARFGVQREALLARRGQRDAEVGAGRSYDFLPETAAIRSGDWRVAPAPADLQKRHVEITGPVERKMMINAFNSGADVFMADFEDSLSPTFPNVVAGQANLVDAVRRTLAFTS